ncbi:NACHT, LRR and PYD domains-containing protein 12-like, partial [Clarias magur]
DSQIKRSDISVPTCVSMKSDESKILPLIFKEQRDSSPGYSILQHGRDKTQQKIMITDTG